MAEALRMALDNSDFSEWAGKQSDDVKEEIMNRVREAFGKGLEAK